MGLQTVPVPTSNGDTQTLITQVQVGTTQTAVRTYADVLAQIEGEEEKGPDTPHHVDLDPQTPEFVQAATPAAKDPINTILVFVHCARAFVVHGVMCSGPLTHKIRQVERAFGGKGGGVIEVRWLLQWNG